MKLLKFRRQIVGSLLFLIVGVAVLMHQRAHADDVVIHGEGFKLTLLETPCTNPDINIMLVMGGADPKEFKAAKVEATQADRITAEACYKRTSKTTIFIIDETGNYGELPLPVAL